MMKTSVEHHESRWHQQYCWDVMMIMKMKMTPEFALLTFVRLQLMLLLPPPTLSCLSPMKASCQSAEAQVHKSLTQSLGLKVAHMGVSSLRMKIKAAQAT